MGCNLSGDDGNISKSRVLGLYVSMRESLPPVAHDMRESLVPMVLVACRWVGDVFSDGDNCPFVLLPRARV